jgi:hypothetical protein
VNTIQLALVAGSAAGLMARRRASGEVSCGLMLGLGVAFKPNLLPIALPLFITLAAGRRPASVARVSAGLAFGGALAIAGSSLFFGGPGCWGEWARILPELLRPPFSVATGNYSLATVLRELTGFDIALPLLAGALGAFAVFEWRRTSRRGSTAPDPPSSRDLEAIAILGLGSALLLWTARLAWLHYFVFAIPLVLFVFRPPDAQAGFALSRREGALALASVVGFLPLSSLAPGLPPLAKALIVNASLLAVVILTLRILWRSGSASLLEPIAAPPGQPGRATTPP